MEHRWHTRWPVNFDVMLYQHDLPVVRCRASNLSSNGMLVHNDSQSLHLDTPVELEFEYQAHEELRRCRFAASIIHQSDQGIGLMFLEEDQHRALAVEDMLTLIRQTEGLTHLT